jgi:hypothetical protein
MLQTSFGRSTLSARTPAGSVNRKKDYDASMDINDSNKGESVKIFITHVAALSWADAPIPEITAAIQSFLNAGFWSACQVEFMVIGDEVLHPVTKAISLASLRNFVPQQAFRILDRQRPVRRSMLTSRLRCIRRARTMKTADKRFCPGCGSELSGALEYCPICMLRNAPAGGTDSRKCFAEPAGTKPQATPVDHRFQHYELMPDENGKPIELGREAMGITYKALDTDLRCPVTLKVISEQYLGDQSVRLRFLREARAAASVRHPNVASVFHLGRVGEKYFYAMEFVEGETLETLIKRLGSLELSLALEIVI